MDELQSTLFWLRLIQLIIAIPLFALAGQAATALLARAMGQPPRQNFFFRLLELIASPAVKPVRWITPRFVHDPHVPIAAFALLCVGYVWAMLAIADACMAAGLAVAECLRNR